MRGSRRQVAREIGRLSGGRMDDVMRWQERNGRHLSAALARLRRLLGRASPMDDHAPGRRRRGCRRRGRNDRNRSRRPAARPGDPRPAIRPRPVRARRAPARCRAGVRQPVSPPLLPGPGQPGARVPEFLGGTGGLPGSELGGARSLGGVTEESPYRSGRRGRAGARSLSHPGG